MVSIGKKFLYDIVVSDGLKLMEIQMICVDGCNVTIQMIC